MPTELRSGELLQPPYFDFMLGVVDVLREQPGILLRLEPQFYEHFACSGCGECCQRPWLISITREYYEQWQAIFARHPSAQYREPFELSPGGNDEHYADLKRKPGTNECVFLTDDRRCFVQANYGEEAMNWVCKTFPRYEGWFGSFLGKFMLHSCPDVATLVQDMPGIRYTLGRVSHEKLAEFQLQAHPLGIVQGYLWLGLQLDLLMNPRLTPIQALRLLREGMRESLELPTQPSIEALVALNQRLRWRSGPDAGSPPLAKKPEIAYDCLDWMLESYQSVRRFVAETQAGLRALPRLSSAEKELLNAFLRSYAGYRLLTMNYYTRENMLQFYPAYFLIAINLALLQWLAMYYREREGGELTREQLLRAGTVVGFKFEHASRLIETLSRMSPEACLESMENLLIFDFGAPV